MKKIIKPWGYEEIIEKNKFYVVKKLYMKKNHRCSLQFHKKKTETIIVLSGKLKIIYGKNKKKYLSKTFVKKQGITLKPYTVHRMIGLTNCLYYEVSTPQLSDVIRLSDDYKRA